LDNHSDERGLLLLNTFHFFHVLGWVRVLVVDWLFFHLCEPGLWFDSLLVNTFQEFHDGRFFPNNFLNGTVWLLGSLSCPQRISFRDILRTNIEICRFGRGLGSWILEVATRVAEQNTRNTNTD
jgi:hypothetical protein